jgi:negative modulator of initiation of replication
MHTLEIDDDINTYLLSKITYFGESPSSVLRRELKLNGSEPAARKEIAAGAPAHELSAFLSSPKMRFGYATDKFLAILAEAHREKPIEYEKALSIQGRDRVYFARSREEIARSGRSTHPRQIPGTGFWVMTNSPTSQKRWMLRHALQVLGYSEPARAEAAKAL